MYVSNKGCRENELVNVNWVTSTAHWKKIYGRLRARGNVKKQSQARQSNDSTKNTKTSKKKTQNSNDEPSDFDDDDKEDDDDDDSDFSGRDEPTDTKEYNTTLRRHIRDPKSFSPKMLPKKKRKTVGKIEPTQKKQKKIQDSTGFSTDEDREVSEDYAQQFLDYEQTFEKHGKKGTTSTEEEKKKPATKPPPQKIEAPSQMINLTKDDEEDKGKKYVTMDYDMLFQMFNKFQEQQKQQQQQQISTPKKPAQSEQKSTEQHLEQDTNQNDNKTIIEGNDNTNI